MSAQNRTALKALITAWTAVLDLETDDKPAMQHILDSVLLNRDVQNTITVSGTGTTNVDFSGYDTIYVTTAYNCELNIQNINDGETKWLHLEKLAGTEVTFAGAIDQSLDAGYITSDLTDMVYMVTKKHLSDVIIKPLMKDFDKTLYYLKTETKSTAEITALLALKQNVLSSSTTTDCTRVASQVDSSSFLVKSRYYGKVVSTNGQIKLNSDPGNNILFTLPVGTPVAPCDWYFSACDADGSTSENIELYQKSGTLEVYAADTSQDRVSSFSYTYIAD